MVHDLPFGETAKSRSLHGRADGGGETRRLADLTTGVFPSSLSLDGKWFAIWDFVGGGSYGQLRLRVETMVFNSGRLSYSRSQFWIRLSPPALRRPSLRMGDGWRMRLLSRVRFRFTSVRFQVQERDGEFPPPAEHSLRHACVLAEPQIRNIVPDAFSPVLAKHSNPNRCSLGRMVGYPYKGVCSTSFLRMARHPTGACGPMRPDVIASEKGHCRLDDGSRTCNSWFMHAG